MAKNPFVCGRDGIRNAVRAEYDDPIGSATFRSLGASWGVSAGVAHKLYNEPNYWPTDPEIEISLLSAAASKGIRLRQRGPRRDLWAFDPRILLWMIENRETVIPGDREK